MPRMRIVDDEVLEKPFNKKQFIRLLGYLKPHKKPMIISILLMVVASVCSLAGPYLIKVAIDEVIGKNTTDGLIPLVIAMIVTSALTAVCTRYRVRLMETAGRTAIATMRQDLFDHIQTLSFSFFDNRPAGKIMVRVINDVNSLNDLFTNGIVNILIDCFTLIIILGIMLFTDVSLTLVAMSTLPLLILIVFVLKRKMRLRWQVTRRKISNMNGYLHESLAGMRVTQAFVREDENAEIFRETNEDIRRSWMSAIRLNLLFWPGIDFVGTVGTALVYLVGVSMMGGGALSVGTLLAITWYLGRFWDPMNNLSNFYNQVLVAMASVERIFEIMDTPADIENKPEAYELPPIEGRVDFEHVTFGYEPGVNVLEDVNIHVEPGQTIALVGPTGAGKSTVVNLISRFYDVIGGAVRVDGHDVRDVTLDSLRSQMGIMMQDSFIFSGTILENIRYSRPDATREEVIEAAKAVHVHDFIMNMEKGYDTEVNERGSRLSIGQKQLISFARALLADPRILILDEATSSIDTHTEILIQQALERLLKGRTSFIIAHRLSTIRKADCIMVVRDGNIAERGTHEELIEQKGHYYELCQAQYRFLQAN